MAGKHTEVTEIWKDMTGCLGHSRFLECHYLVSAFRTSSGLNGKHSLWGCQGPRSLSYWWNSLTLYLPWVSLTPTYGGLTGIQCSGHQECYVQMGQQRIQTHVSYANSKIKFLKIPRKQLPSIKPCWGPFRVQALCNGTGHRPTKLALGLNKQNETV